MANLTKTSGSSIRSTGKGRLIATFQSYSSDRVYEIREAKDTGGLYCNCPAWRFQKGKSPQARTCKHLKAFTADGAKALPSNPLALKG